MKKIVKLIVFVLIICIIFAIIYVIRDPIMRKIYKIEYEEYVDKYSEEYDVDKYLIFAIIKAESNFDEKAQSNKGAKGLMQLMDATAGDIAKSLDMKLDDGDILIPEININLGTNYIAMLINKYENIELALAAYNAGSGNVDTWIDEGTLQDNGSDIENIPYNETNNYVRKILRDYDIYKELYDTN